MIDIMATKMAEGIKKRSPEHPASVAVLKHSLAVLINTFSILFLNIGIGFVTGRLREVIIVLISFALLRMISGGVHLKSGTWCVTITTLGVTALAHINLLPEVVPWITVASLVIAAIFAPTDLRRQSRIPVRYYPFLKLISVSMIACNFYLSSSAIAVSFLIQTLTLIPRREVEIN